MSGSNAVAGVARGDNVPEPRPLCKCEKHPLPANDGTGTDHLTDYSPTDQPWDLHKAQADAVALIYGAGGEEWFRYATRMRGCAGKLAFGWTSPEETGETKLKLVGADFCRIRTCTVCAWRRSLMHKARFLERIPRIMAAHPGARWIFLTLTVRNCPVADLRAQIKTMNKAWAKFLKWNRWPATGWIKSIEVTRGGDGSAHPHFHCLLLVPGGYFGGRSYIKQQDWSDKWQAVARLDYAPIVDVRAVKVGGEASAAAEALKYATKASDLTADPAWLLEYTRQVNRLRFIDAGGVLRGVLADEETGDMIHTDEEAEGDELDEEAGVLVFGWKRKEKRYKRKQRSDDV